MDLPLENKRLRGLIDKHSFGSENAFAKKIGINSTAINRLFRVDSRTNQIPSALKSRSVLEAINKKFPDIDRNWFLNVSKEEGSKKEKSKPLFQNELTEVSVRYMKIPFVSVKAQAGFPTGFGDELYMDELDNVLWEIDDKEYKGSYIVFEVAGDSMDDGTKKSLEDGDKILCREVPRHLWQYKLHYKQWNFVLSHPEDGVTVKRITDHNVETGIIKCHSLNVYYEDFDLNINELSAIFNVVDIKRSARI